MRDDARPVVTVSLVFVWGQDCSVCSTRAFLGGKTGEGPH